MEAAAAAVLRHHAGTKLVEILSEGASLSFEIILDLKDKGYPAYYVLVWAFFNFNVRGVINGKPGKPYTNFEIFHKVFGW